MLTIDVVTPTKKLLTTQADAITLPGVAGEVGLLPGHIALVTALKPGPMSIKRGNSTEWFVLGGGVAQCDSDRVLVLAETAETQGEIDRERAEKALKAAEKAILEHSEFSEQFAETQAALARATARLNVAKLQ